MKKTIFILLTFVLISACFAQLDGRVKVFPIGFYNLENLYYPYPKDTVIKGGDSLRDIEFSPEGSNAWTFDRYEKKLNNMGYAISQIAKDFGGVIALGVSEIGNKKVLEDLVKTEPIAHRNLQVVHHDSPDLRGVDVGLLYDPSVFTFVSSRTYPFILPDDPSFKTRDVLLVNGIIDNERVSILVNHWPSRRGVKSVGLREFAASINLHITDSILSADSTVRVIIMGDLNDDPTDLSCRSVLQAKRDQHKIHTHKDLFNTMWSHYSRGIGSLCYQGKWNLFDQIIISGNFIGTDYSTLKFYRAEVFNKDFLISKTGRYKGYPMRTFSAGTFINGYSDHFPTLIYIVKY